MVLSQTREWRRLWPAIQSSFELISPPYVAKKKLRFVDTLNLIQLWKVNIASSEFKANPFPFYASLRSEAPVYLTKLPDRRNAWLVTRYQDICPPEG
jgi:hypothetical protein